MLLVYDQTDRFVNHSEGDRLRELCPGATLFKTNGYSHQKILEAPEVVQAVSEFLTKKVA
jgi:pimeloyl-ACP methyl ester carboxylesterase